MSSPRTQERTRPVEPDPADLDAVLERLEEDAGVNVAGALAQVRELEQVALTGGDPVLLWRFRLLRADLTERSGDSAEAVTLLWQVHEWATAHGCRRALSRAHELLGRVHRALGDLVANLDHLIQAVEAMDGTTPPPRRIACLVKLADALAETGSMPLARERFAQAEHDAVTQGDVVRQAMVLNNWAYHEYEAGAGAHARTILDRLLAVSDAHGRDLDYCDLDTMARVALQLGEYEQAEAAARASMRAYAEQDVAESDGEADLLLTLATVQRHRGDLAGAAATLHRCRSLCPPGLPGFLGVQVRLEQVELHAAAGDFEAAYLDMRAYHDAEKELLCAQREAQARDAVLDLEELRRRVASHDWGPVTGELPVATSIGVSVATADSTRQGLLARADEALYRAKDAGRNRLCVDPLSGLTERRRFRALP
ncbi:hypothetical protein ACWKSP_01105 [Micromonosporaceae bacterium Da 78-11]